MMPVIPPHAHRPMSEEAFYALGVRHGWFAAVPRVVRGLGSLFTRKPFPAASAAVVCRTDL